jgi:hypothetical protein
MASKKTLEKRGSISPISQLNSDGWRSLIYVIYYDPAIATEMTASKQTQLSDWISSGIRQKFTICNKQEVSAWVKIINKALENQKTNEACKEYKVASEGDSVSDLIMAKLVKAWLMNHKQETIEIKNNLKKEQALAESQGDKKNEKEVKGAPPPTAAAAKKPPNPKGTL